MKDGTVGWNPGRLNPKIDHPAGPIDPQIDILRIDRPGAKTPAAILTRFPLHPDTVGGTEYSADFPHYLEETLREKLAPNLMSIFAQGTSGNINHVNVPTDDPQKGPANRNPARLPGRQYARHQESWRTKSFTQATVSSPRYSRIRVRPCTRRIRHGQGDACTGPGLQADLLRPGEIRVVRTGGDEGAWRPGAAGASHRGEPGRERQDRERGAARGWLFDRGHLG